MNAILLAALAMSGATGLHGHSRHGGDCYECYDDDGSGGDDRRRGMPQSCYNPSFGCYPSTRFMHRYPAFHNYYYRRAYNYRHYFDYPWHAGLHEPTSMFSYGVPGEEGPAASPPVPVPAPMASIRREPTPARMPTIRTPTPALRSADHLAPIVTPQSLR
jgi:hypothetical protein